MRKTGGEHRGEERSRASAGSRRRYWVDDTERHVKSSVEIAWIPFRE